MTNSPLLVYERVLNATATTIVLGGTPETFFTEFKEALAVGDSCVYELFVVERWRAHVLAETGVATLSQGNVLTRKIMLQSTGKPAAFEKGDDAQWFVRLKDRRELDSNKLVINMGVAGTYLVHQQSDGLLIRKVI